MFGEFSAKLKCWAACPKIKIIKTVTARGPCKTAQSVCPPTLLSESVSMGGPPGEQALAGVMHSVPVTQPKSLLSDIC